MHVAKTKALISFAVTVFVFAYADCWFSHEAAHFFQSSLTTKALISLECKNWRLVLNYFRTILQQS